MEVHHLTTTGLSSTLETFMDSGKQMKDTDYWKQMSKSSRRVKIHNSTMVLQQRYIFVTLHLVSE